MISQVILSVTGYSYGFHSFRRPRYEKLPGISKEWNTFSSLAKSPRLRQSTSRLAQRDYIEEIDRARGREVCDGRSGERRLRRMTMNRDDRGDDDEDDDRDPRSRASPEC